MYVYFDKYLFFLTKAHASNLVMKLQLFIQVFVCFAVHKVERRLS